ncbi:hypothetical protein B566_EDAN007603 [Ephemera danica]|nr:hypothetical protein B566_EDAN007603 [Ephemera danica]
MHPLRWRHEGEQARPAGDQVPAAYRPPCRGKGCAVVTNCARASSLVLGRTRGSSSLSTTSTEAPPKLQERVDDGVEDDAEDAEGTTLPPVNATTKSPLTGVPQNDYKYDPNLPRELNGYNLSDYPFFNSVPEDINFNCEGLKDGFYASVPHKCQLYHHCLYGTRYDFLCANYTAFDQRTFICHFVSEVDCINSPKFFSRNEALYKQDSTTTSSTTTTSTTPAPSQDSRDGGGGGRGRGGGRRRRPSRKRPVDYYDEYDDDDYEDPPPRRGTGSRRRPRPENRRPSGPAKDDYDVDPPPRPSKAPASTEETPLPTKPNRAVFEKPRSPPRIRPPVPVNERDKFLRPGEDLDTQSRPSKAPPRHSEDDYEEYEDSPPPRKNRKPARIEEDDDQEEDEYFRRMPPQGANGRPLRRNRGPSRRRPSRYEEYDDESDYRDEPRRKRPSRRPDDDYDDFDEAPRRKRPSRTQDDVTSAGSLRSRAKVRPQQYTDDYEDEPPRRKGQRKPSTTTTTTSTTTTTTERPTTSQRPRRVTSTTPYPYDDDYYYDEESFENREEVKPATVVPIKPVAKHTEVTLPAVTEASTEAVSTKRTPFVPRKTTPLPDVASKSTMKFSQFKATDETEETPYVFKIDDYVKPTTRAPFIPRGSKAPSTETETSEGSELKEPAATRRPKPNWQPSHEEDPKPAVQPTVKDVLQSRPAAFTPRQKATTAIPIEATDDDYPNSAPAKAPIKETVQQRPVAFASRPKVTPVAVALPQQPTAAEDYPETQKVVTRTPSRLPSSKPQPPTETTAKEDYRYIPLSQYKPISQSVPSAPTDQDDYTRGRVSYNNSPQFKPSAPDFTSPAADLIPPRGKIGTPPSDIASKSPGAPPPRSRLSTSFLPRGLSPVGGARSKLTSTTAAVPDIDDEEDDAINDALHPTGSDASSTISSQRFSPYQTRSRNPQPIRGGSYYNTEQTTAASQATFTRIPSYDDYSDNPPRSRYNAQVALPFPTTALDTFARQPSAPSSFRAAAAIRPAPPQQSRESATRSERRPIAAASVQYSTQQEPASSAWGPRDYFYTY